MPAGLEGLMDPSGDLVDLAEAVDLDHEIPRAVDGDERRRLAGEDILAVTDGLFRVVEPTLRDGALAEAGDHLVGVGHELNHGVEALVPVGEQAVEELDLVERAWIAVEQEPVEGVLLGQSSSHEFIGQFVRHVVAGIDDRLHLEAEVGSGLDVVTEDVSGRDRRDSRIPPRAWPPGCPCPSRAGRG